MPILADAFAALHDKSPVTHHCRSDDWITAALPSDAHSWSFTFSAPMATGNNACASVGRSMKAASFFQHHQLESGTTLTPASSSSHWGSSARGRLHTLSNISSHGTSFLDIERQEYFQSEVREHNSRFSVSHRIDPGRPLVFQDVDGVLNDKDPNVALQDKLINRLDEMVGKTDAQIVLSTQWRKSLHALHALLQRLALTKNHLDERIVGATPSLCRGVECRAKEIRAWLQTHPTFRGNWVALDDWSLTEQPGGEHLLGHFVNTDPEVGLTRDDVAESIRLLEAETEAEAVTAA